MISSIKVLMNISLDLLIISKFHIATNYLTPPLQFRNPLLPLAMQIMID
jgi:hypothetical protein